MPLLEKCRDGGGHLGTGRIYIPGAANMTSQCVMYMKIIKYKSSPSSGDKHINYRRLDKVLERNHRFLPPQIIWSVDLIRGVLF